MIVREKWHIYVFMVKFSSKVLATSAMFSYYHFESWHELLNSKLSFHVQSWVKLAVTGENDGVPSARRDHATTPLGTGEYPQLFMTGGIDKNWRSLGDAWILNLEREADGKISQGSWFKVTITNRKSRILAGIDLPLSLYYITTLPFYDVSDPLTDLQIKNADNAEPLTPRYSLTVNNYEDSTCEQQFHLMIFGGITSKNLVIAETTILGEHDYSFNNTCV